METLTPEDYKLRIEHLQQIKTAMPEIWQMITQSRCCPSYIGLTDYCRFEAGYQCETCWLANLPKNPELAPEA